MPFKVLADSDMCPLRRACAINWSSVDTKASSCLCARAAGRCQCLHRRHIKMGVRKRVRRCSILFGALLLVSVWLVKQRSSPLFLPVHDLTFEPGLRSDDGTAAYSISSVLGTAGRKLSQVGRIVRLLCPSFCYIDSPILCFTGPENALFLSCFGPEACSATGWKKIFRAAELSMGLSNDNPLVKRRFCPPNCLKALLDDQSCSDREYCARAGGRCP